MTEDGGDGEVERTALTEPRGDGVSDPAPLEDSEGTEISTLEPSIAEISSAAVPVDEPEPKPSRARRLWTDIRHPRATLKRWWSAPARGPKLSSDELHERLTLKSIYVIEELHAVALRQVQSEEMRDSRLDAKAQALVVSASLTLTVAFTFGGLVLQHPEYIEPLGAITSRAVVFCYLIALLLGLAASFVAIRALFVRADYQGVDGRTLFGQIFLAIADDEPDVGAQAAYRRYATAHYWQIAQHNSTVHDAKADTIKRGQFLFIGFLFCLMLIGLGLGYSAFLRIQAPAVPMKASPCS